MTASTFHYGLPNTAVSAVQSSRLAEFVLLLFGMLSLGVFEPQYHAVNFNELQLGETIADISTANPYNQLRWLALAALAVGVVLARGPAELMRVTLRAWPLFLLFGYCLLSALWSDYPTITLRRSFGLILPAFCLLVAMVYIGDLRRAALIIYVAFWAALLLNASALPLSSAYDEFGFFRGVLGNKNTLGSVAVPAILVGMAIGPWLKVPWSNILRLLYLGVWLAILILSVSRTSWALLLAVPALFIAISLASYATRMSFLATSIVIFGLGLVSYGVAYGILGYSPLDLVAPGTTLNGRTEIWSFMAQEIGKSDLILGSGFGAFWGVGYGAANLSSVYEYIHLLNQAHNGYIDVLASLGVVGLALCLMVFVCAAAASEQFRRDDPYLYRLVWFLLLFAFLHNAMESSALVPFNSVWHLTLFAIVTALVAVPSGRVAWRT